MDFVVVDEGVEQGVVNVNALYESFLTLYDVVTVCSVFGSMEYGVPEEIHTVVFYEKLHGKVQSLVLVEFIHSKTTL